MIDKDHHFKLVDAWNVGALNARGKANLKINDKFVKKHRKLVKVDVKEHRKLVKVDVKEHRKLVKVDVKEHRKLV